MKIFNITQSQYLLGRINRVFSVDSYITLLRYFTEAQKGALQVFFPVSQNPALDLPPDLPALLAQCLFGPLPVAAVKYQS